MPHSPTQHACPKCNRMLTASGVVEDVELGELGVFQCDECIAVWEFGGEDFETALTFAVGADGQPRD